MTKNDEDCNQFEEKESQYYIEDSNWLYDEVDALWSTRSEVEHDHFLDTFTDNSEKDAQQCPGCRFLNSRVMVSQWLEHSVNYKPKILSSEHSPKQCEMKDVVMDIVCEKKLNFRFYNVSEYVSRNYPIPKISCEHFSRS